MKRLLDSPPENSRSNKMSISNASTSSNALEVDQDGATGSNLRVISTIELESLLTRAVRGVFDEKIEPMKEKLEAVAEEVQDLKAENANLQNRIEALQNSQTASTRQVTHLENNLKRRNLIFRGLAANNDIKDAVRNIIVNTMKVNIPNLILCSCRKIYEKERKITVVAEFPDEETVNSILKCARNLQGTRITLERDLSQQRQENRKAMISLKSMLREVNNDKLVAIRNDEMRIDGKWFRWSVDKVLMHQQEKNGMNILANIYNNQLDLSKMSYHMLVNLYIQRSNQQ